MLKFALIATALAATLVTLVYIVQSQNDPDPPTAASSDANLKRIGLPDDLPKMPVRLSDGDAAEDAFAQLLQACQDADRVINGGFEEEKKVEKACEVCRMLQSSIASGKYPEGFADRQIKVSELETEQQVVGLRSLKNALRICINAHREAGEYEAVDEAALACFDLGHRLFTQNVRLKPRMHGLSLMKTGLTALHTTAGLRHKEGLIDDAAWETQQQRNQAWIEAIAAIEARWLPKVSAIGSVEPEIGDLIRVAQLDEDPTFRVFATLQLGYAKLIRGDAGNHPAIVEAIEQAKASDDPQIKAAAEAADTMTIEHYRAIVR